MSLENSQYTFHSLQGVDKATFQKEVDRITKEVDQVENDVGPAGSASAPAKRGRFSQSQQPQPSGQSNYEYPLISGTILEVVLEDFLCHANMKVALNREINFIVGRNGSGKSAILTGIVVALGGNASITGRGVALKDFVKHGCASARVTCVISNSGALSYKREEYGDKIVVVRTIQSHGGSSIKMRSDRGKLVSSKMEDLRAMTLQLGIQVDNPISVLDQNTARHFLNQSKPNNKFELFMRATNLETLQNIYVEISLAVDRTNQEIKKKERQLIDNNTEVQEAQRKYDMVQNLETDREKGHVLKMELLWAQCRDMLSALEHSQKELNKAQKEKEKLDQTLSTEEQTEPILQQIEGAKSELISLEAQRKDFDTDLKDLKTKFTMVNQKQKKLEQEKQVIASKLNNDRNNIELYKTEIRSQEQKMLPEHVDKRRKQREEIHELQTLLQQFKAERDSQEVAVRNLQHTEQGINETVRHLRRNKANQENDLRKLEGRLEELETATSNLSLFGPCMPELVRQIEGSRQFKKKPVGPFGSYVKVKDPKWALAVESVIKGRLHTFVVDNLEDEKLLHTMIKRICTRGPKPGVIRTRFPTTVYDTTRTAARTSEYCNVLDMVDISNVVAHNLLIDNCKLESTMLIPTDKECFDLLSHVQSVPSNCSRAFTLKADTYFPAPRFASYGSSQRSASVLQTSRDVIIRDTKLRIGESKEMLKVTTADLHKSSKELEDIRGQIQQLRSAMSKISKQSVETQSKLEKLKDTEQPDTNSVSVLREELAVKEKELEEKLSKLQEFPEKIKALEDEKMEFKKQGSELQNKLKEVVGKIDEVIKEQNSRKEQIEEIRSAQVGKKRKLEQVTKQVDVFTKECKELEERHEKANKDAEKLESHLRSETEEKQKEFRTMSNTRRNVKVIDQELRALNKRLASVEKTLGQSAATTEKDYLEKIASYKATRKYIVALKHNANFMKQALGERKSLYHTQKKLMCGVVSHQFTRVLRYRNCTGSVGVNFEKRTLEISVGPIDEGERAGLGTSSLSGGERSYATMAFVIALWNVTELPFYFLDEFDVFMDMLNRQTVLTLLLKFAKQKRGYQFGFLTPLDTTAVQGSDQVSIFRLADPRS